MQVVRFFNERKTVQWMTSNCRIKLNH